jgi:hypothetical protein
MPGRTYESYFKTGPITRGEGHRNQTSEFITVFGKAVVNSSALVRSKWDWANSITSKKWSGEQQAYTVNRTGRSLSRKRILLRGTGPTLQLHFRSEDGKPFNIVGWSMWDSVDAVP